MAVYRFKTQALCTGFVGVREGMMKRAAVLIALLLSVIVGGCKDFPGADGRYATHDRGASNRGGAMQGLPVTPYNPH